MQDATANFAAAVSASSVSWLPPSVYADWAQDGYGAAESIDDLSGQAAGIVVNHALSDGLPDEVSFVAIQGVPTLTADLGGRDEMTPAAYFSPFRTDSAVYGFERDVAPLKVDHGLVTAAGGERVRVFTGQMADVPVRGGRASLAGISATRLALAALVQPPVRARREQGLPFGLNATWAVSYVLHACGVYPSPPAMTGCRLWLPLYGCGHSFAPAANVLTSNFTGVVFGLRRRTGDDGIDYYSAEPQTVRGPYVGGLNAQVTSTELLGATGTVSANFDDTLVAGDDWLSQAGARGRVQFWVRGDAADANNTPGGSANFAWGTSGVTWLAGMEASSFVTTPYVVAGVNLSRNVFVNVFDGTNNVTLSSSATLPTDGDWHFIGAAWDVAGNKLWVRLDGVTETSTPTMSTAGLPVLTEPEADKLVLAFTLPSADFQFSTGSGADPDDTPTWLNTLSWTRGAVVYPSSLELEVLAEPAPREAWELIGALAQTEQAATRIDENDQMLYLPRGYFATVDQQTVAQTITTATDAALPDVILDPSMVRNVARVSYDQTRIDEVRSLVLDLRTVLVFPPGVSTFRIALDTAAIQVYAGTLTNLTAAQIDGSDLGPPGWSYITVNSATDGSGDVIDAGQVTAVITEWTAGEVAVEVTNNSAATLYAANNSSTAGTDFAYLGVYGFAVRTNTTSVTESYDSSVDVRGDRAIAVDLPMAQRYDNAYRAARRIVGDLAYPVPIIDQVEVFGDPRRQPGDLVTFADPSQTGADGQWRSYVVRHRIDGADYRQTMKLRQATLTGQWGDGVSRWGSIVWAGEE